MNPAARGSRAHRRHAPASRQAQRGIALIVAILLVALGTILASAIAYENAMTARRGSGTYAFDESILIAQGAEALAAYGIRQFYQSDPAHVYIGQGWDKPVGPMEVVPGAMLEASLEDLQGRFNLNNLVGKDGTPNTANVAAFAQLLELVGLETKWAPMMVDWIDADLTPQTIDGAEDSVYSGQVPPYRTANRYITSASELLALPGFGRDRYLALAPYVTALPVGTKINLCTAKDKVLDAFLGPGHTDFSSTSGQLDKNRAQGSTGCFPTVAGYQAAFSDPNLRKAVPNNFGQTSVYFRLTSFIIIGGAEFNSYSLLFRDGTGAVRPIQRSFTPD